MELSAHPEDYPEDFVRLVAFEHELLAEVFAWGQFPLVQLCCFVLLIQGGTPSWGVVGRIVGR